MTTHGPAYEREHDERRLRTQLEVIRDVMLSAAECGAWLTLREIEGLTRYPQASISAQLRHLRKPAFGSYIVAKRRRGHPGQGVWEYRLGPRRDGQGVQLELVEEGKQKGKEAKSHGSTETQRHRDRHGRLRRQMAGLQGLKPIDLADDGVRAEARTS